MERLTAGLIPLPTHLSEVLPLVVAEDHGLPLPVVAPPVLAEPVHALVSVMPGHCVRLPHVAARPVHTLMSDHRSHVGSGDGAPPGGVVRHVTVVIRAGHPEIFPILHTWMGEICDDSQTYLHSLIGTLTNCLFSATDLRLLMIELLE